MNLNQVTLPAADIDESVEFYQRLGLDLIVRSPHYARFKCPEGDSTFSIHSADKPQLPSTTVVYFETRLMKQAVRLSFLLHVFRRSLSSSFRMQDRWSGAIRASASPPPLVRP